MSLSPSKQNEELGALLKVPLTERFSSYLISRMSQIETAMLLLSTFR